jgi:hypothetical protein
VIMEVVTFFALLLVGGSLWYLLEYVLDLLFNWYMVYYPVYATMAVIPFLQAIVAWGVLLLCMVPAAIYLWTNTQRPEANR